MSSLTIPKSRETLIRESLCREASVRLHRENEAHIVDAPPLEEPKLPVYQRERVNYYQIILSAISLKQFLP